MTVEFRGMVGKTEAGRSQGTIVAGQALWQWRQMARQQAIAANISPNEVDWLLRELAGVDRLSLRLESFKDASEVHLQVSIANLKTLWQQRLEQRVPVQYLVGSAPWRQFTLKVSPAVLIPRSETECLIDLAIAAVQSANAPMNWADLGTGSGAIALGLATAFPQAVIHAVDCSLAALAIARENAASYDLNDRIHCYPGSWFEPLAAWRGQLNGVVANPPYIPSAIVPTLQPEVAQHEPHLALDGGADGLDAARHLVATAPDYLATAGIFLVELMAGQAESVAALLRQQGSYTQVQIYPDLAGIDRFVRAYRR
jgi:release factor glutamine methyltransferase